jgi:2-oxoisovalerate dehydrogenase E2 component (dihydrolipoyl transacylase)
MTPYSFKLPDVGEGIAEAEIVAWHVQPGDLVAEDAPFVDVMTDKATVEITSPVTGVVVSVAGRPGDLAAIGSVLAVLEVEGQAGIESSPIDPDPVSAEQTPEATTARPAPSAAIPPAPSPPRPAPVQPPPPAPRFGSLPRGAGAKPLAAPSVRRRAVELGVPLRTVPGSGPAGRITQGDLTAFLSHDRPAAQSTALARRDGIEVVKVIGLRRRISERMTLAKQRIPHFSYIEEIDVTELDRLRAQLNAANSEALRLTILPFLARALVKALPAFPQINAIYDDEAGEIQRHAAVHLGVATQTPAGLMVPVVRHAEALDLWGVAAEVSRLAAEARAGRASRDDLSGSTITITSLGMLGGLATTPVINRPEVAIVGPNRIIERPVAVQGEIVLRKMMILSSSFDHRVVDGWEAAEFVQLLKRLLETPALLFLDQP